MSPEFTILGITIHWYGIIIALAVMCGVLLALKLSKSLGIDQDSIMDFALLAIPMAIIGARIYYVVFQWDLYKDNPISVLYIWEGGLAIYGGVLAGILAGIIFAKIKKINFWQLADLGAPCLILGQAIGRWGNFVNQEAYGRLVTNPAWQWFPASVYISNALPGKQGWYMATFFYESIWNFAVFIFLLTYIKKRKRKGEVFLFYLILYSFGRFIIEGFRTDSLYIANTSIRSSQLLSLILFTLGLTLFISGRIREAKKASANQDLDIVEDTLVNSTLDEQAPEKQIEETRAEDLDGKEDATDALAEEE